MTDNTRGTLVPQGNLMRIDNALVEEVSFSGRSTGFVIVSYSVPMPNGAVFIDTVRLNVSPNTVIINSFGLPLCLCDLQKGTWVNAVFSAAMTRSIPPQSNAFLIAAQQGNSSPSNLTTGRIAMVDVENNFLYTGNPNNINSQMRYVITDRTVIRDRNGQRIGLRDLQPGRMILVEHANFQTASIPPQTTAFYIQLL